MKLLKVKRVIGAAGFVAATAVAVPLMTAGTAQATAVACDNYLVRAGYNVGPKLQNACLIKGPWAGAANPVCIGQMVAIGVKPDDANEACSRA